MVDCMFVKFNEHIRRSGIQVNNLRNKLRQKETDLKTCLEHVVSVTSDYVDFIGNSIAVLNNVNCFLKLIKKYLLFLQHALQYVSETKLYLSFLVISVVVYIALRNFG